MLCTTMMTCERGSCCAILSTSDQPQICCSVPVMLYPFIKDYFVSTNNVEPLVFFGSNFHDMGINAEGSIKDGVSIVLMNSGIDLWSYKSCSCTFEQLLPMMTALIRKRYTLRTWKRLGKLRLVENRYLHRKLYVIQWRLERQILREWFQRWKACLNSQMYQFSQLKIKHNASLLTHLWSYWTCLYHIQILREQRAQSLVEKHIYELHIKLYGDPSFQLWKSLFVASRQFKFKVTLYRQKKNTFMIRDAFNTWKTYLRCERVKFIVNRHLLQIFFLKWLHIVIERPKTLYFCDQVSNIIFRIYCSFALFQLKLHYFACKRDLRKKNYVITVWTSYMVYIKQMKYLYMQFNLYYMVIYCPRSLFMRKTYILFMQALCFQRWRIAFHDLHSNEQYVFYFNI